MKSIENLIRENIKQLKPYTSARSSYLTGLLLDANENSYGSVVSIDEIELNRYPDPSHNELREKLAEYLKVDKKKIFCGVGSDEIIDLLIRIFCEPGKDKTLIFEPTYGMYKVACDINNVETGSLELTKDFQINFNEFEKTDLTSVKLIFLCSPNNPTGNLLSTNDIKKLADKFDGVVVVDQAYVDFANDELIDIINDYENIVLTRTFSKAWGLAGIRCGFSISNNLIVDTMMKVKAPYNLNKLTLHFALQALNNVEQRNKFVHNILSERERVFNELLQIQGVMKVYPTDANFILFRVEDADKVYKKMTDKNVIIRNRANQVNLKGCLRVTIGKPEENDKFLTTLKEVL